MRARITKLLSRQSALSSSSSFICERCRVRLVSAPKRSLFEGLKNMGKSDEGSETSGRGPTAMQVQNPVPRAPQPQASSPQEQTDSAERLDWDGLEWVGSKKWIRQVEAERQGSSELNYRAAETKLLPGKWVKDGSQRGVEEVRQLVTNIVKETFPTITEDPNGAFPPDAAVRLQIFQNIVKHTGVRIPDGDVRNIHTIDDLTAKLSARPKPSPDRAIRHHAELHSIPNVKIIPRNRTLREDVDRQRGTSKRIEEALQARGLAENPRLSRRV